MADRPAGAAPLTQLKIFTCYPVVVENSFRTHCATPRSAANVINPQMGQRAFKTLKLGLLVHLALRSLASVWTDVKSVITSALRLSRKPGRVVRERLTFGFGAYLTIEAAPTHQTLCKKSGFCPKRLLSDTHPKHLTHKSSAHRSRG